MIRRIPDGEKEVVDDVKDWKLMRRFPKWKSKLKLAYLFSLEFCTVSILFLHVLFGLNREFSLILRGLNPCLSNFGNCRPPFA